MKEIEAFLIDCKKILGTKGVLSKVSRFDDYLQNVSGFEREVLGVVIPSETIQVQEIIKLANKYLIPLYPISQGKNWGLGSRLPPKNNAVIVDLKKLNKIRSLDHTHGYVIIEPGVTQYQLAKYLEDQDAQFILDVTGSGKDTSVIGNTIERGVAYNTLRVESIANIEVVLGNGKLINTGFGHMDNLLSSYIFKYGLGPSIDGLFIQSNMGIVTAAAIRLMPKTDYSGTFLLRIRNNNELPEVMTKIRFLMRLGIISSVVHVGNRARTSSVIGPLLAMHKQKTNDREVRKLVDAWLAKNILDSWTAIGSLRGDRDQISVSKRLIKKNLSGYCKVSFVDDNKLRLIRNYLQLLSFTRWGRDWKAYLNAISPLLGLTKGIPTDAALHSVHWPLENNDYRSPDLDSSSSGFLYCLPIIPNDEESIIKCLSIVNKSLKSEGFEPYITLNTINSEALEGVINIVFNKEDKSKVVLARKTILSLQTELLNKGYPPYRLSIDGMAEIIESTEYWELIKDIKATLDPNNIISPGRYNLT